MTKEEFYKTEKLYHYTSFGTALNILETNEIWFNHLKDWIHSKNMKIKRYKLILHY